MAEPSKVRKTPCASCPFRKSVPSGVWHEEEYEKLRGYDGDISDQMEAGATAAFGCHHADGQLCAGWAGFRDPLDLISVRLGLSMGNIDQSIIDYKTSVPLFESGAEAADHGELEIDDPSPEAIRMSEKITRTYLTPPKEG